MAMRPSHLRTKRETGNVSPQHGDDSAVAAAYLDKLDPDRRGAAPPVVRDDVGVHRRGPWR